MLNHGYVTAYLSQSFSLSTYSISKSPILPLLVSILSKEEYLLAIRHLLFFRYFSLALRVANVLVRDGRRTKPSLSVGTGSLVSNSSSWHLFLKTLSFCKSVIFSDVRYNCPHHDND